MGSRYFFFGNKKKIDSSDEVITIGKTGDYLTLEGYLTSKGFSIYDFCKNHMPREYFQSSDVFVTSLDETPLELRLREPLIPRSCLVIVEKDIKKA